MYNFNNLYEETCNRVYALRRYPGIHGFDNDKVPPFTDSKFIAGHAYGYLINPYHSRILVLDLDEYNKDTLDFIVNTFLEQEQVEVIDIAISSYKEDETPKGRHIYVGLKDYCNLIPLYSIGIEGTCKGFNALIVEKGEVVIRSSPKFFMGNCSKQTIIRWEEGYTKIGDNKCLKFMSEQLIAPLNIVDAQSSIEPPKAKRILQLRG